jgi:hypothetical protein
MLPVCSQLSAMPVVGLGLWKAPADVTEAVVYNAVKIGYAAPAAPTRRPRPRRGPVRRPRRRARASPVRRSHEHVCSIDARVRSQIPPP